MQDPEIRQRLLENAKHHDKVHREDFVKSWKRMKRALALFDKPHNNKREILQEKPNDFRKDQMVYVDYKTIVKKGDLALRRAFRAKRGNKYIFKIAEVNVLQKYVGVLITYVVIIYYIFFCEFSDHICTS